MELEDVLDEQLKEKLVQKLNQYLDKLPDNVRERIREYIVSTQGKMLRPLLVVASAKLMGATEEQMEIAFTSGVVVELLHNFTLIHDDIIDDAPKRRGKDSYHIRHGRELAIHDGDMLHSYALSFLNHTQSLRLMLDISNLVGVGNGIELEDRLNNVFNFTKDHVIEVLKLKTAIVFFGCVKLAGYACEKEELTESLGDIITDGGIAFQIQDDLLDIMGDKEKFGKESYHDIQESKRNLFLYYSLQTEHRDELVRIYSKGIGDKTEDEIKFVLSIFKTVHDLVIKDRDDYLESCLDRLDKKISHAESSNQNELVKLFNFLRDLIIYLCTREK